MFREMSAAVYHAHSAISKSGLDQIAKSPAHYYAWCTQKPEPTADMIFGTALHAAVLEPKLFEKDFVKEPKVNKRTDAGKAEIAKFHELCKAEGKTVLDDDDFALIEKMRDLLLKHPYVRGLLDTSAIEQSMFWTDEKTGVECKGRVDLLTDGLIVDLKSTKDASLEVFKKSVVDFRYNVQNAMYSRGAGTILRKPHDFLFIAIEKVEPHPIVFYNLDAESIRHGAELLDRDLLVYARCKANNSFLDVQTISLPYWA